MNQLKTMYGTTPESFSLRIKQTLAQQTRPFQPRRRLRLALAVALIALLLAATALAVFHSRVAEVFGRHNPELGEDLQNGRIAPVAESCTLGDVTFTLDEVTYIDDGLYAVGHIAPAQGANVLIMSEDQEHTPDDPVGTDRYSGVIPDGPTYGEKAAQTGAKMLFPTVMAGGVGVEDGPVLPVEWFATSQRPQADGSLLFTLEIPTGTAVTDGESYTLDLWVTYYEYDRVDETYQEQEWTVPVIPRPAKEVL